MDFSGDVPAGATPDREAAAHQLRQTFLAWQAAEPQLLEAVQKTPRLSDAAVRVEQLGELADVGLSALTYLETNTTPPADWQARQMSTMDAAQQPSALVRVAFLQSLRKLVVAAAQDRAGWVAKKNVASGPPPAIATARRFRHID